MAPVFPLSAVVNTACPFARDTGVPTFTPLISNCTRPVGVGLPVVESTTFAFSVIFPLGVMLEAEVVAVVVEEDPAGST